MLKEQQQLNELHQFEATSPRGTPAYVGKTAPFGTVRSPSALAAATVNGTGPHPTPVKTAKKLSLSDYKAARMKKTGTSITITPENSLQQQQQVLPSDRVNKMCVSYTISEDMSGDRRNKILSRLSEKKRDSCEVRLRIRGANADRWSLRHRREVGEDNGGSASSETLRRAMREPEENELRHA